MSTLWDEYQARYKRATGLNLPEPSTALELWGRDSDTPRLTPLRGFTGGAASGPVVSNASGVSTGSEFGDRELSEARNLGAAIEGAGESIPERGLGFLEGALGFIDRGRAAVTGAVSGTLNMVGTTLEGVGVDNPLDEWTAETWNGDTGDDWRPDGVGEAIANTPWGRALRGLTGAEKYGAGDFEGPLKFQEDDGFLERAAKSGATFVTEVGLDPLTYLTLGVGAVGKQAASLGAKGAATLLAKELGDDAVRGLATRNTAYKALREAADAGDTENVVRTVATRIAPSEAEVDATAKTLLSKYGTAAKVLDSREAASEFATDQLVDELGQAFLARGGRGVRQYLADNPNITREQAQKLWDELPAEVKGGVRLSVPFTRTSSPALVGDLDNPILDRLGLGGLADRAYAARGAVSTSRPLTAARGKISGESGEAWSEALQQSYRGAKDVEAPTTGAYTTWAKLNDAKRVQRTADAQLGSESSRWLEYAVKPIALLPSGEQEAATEMFQSFFTNPTLRKSADASATEQAAWDAAETLRRGVDRKRDQALAEGITVNEAQDYVTRAMTEEAQQARAAARGAKKRGRAGTGGLDPTKAREAFMKVVGEDADGNLVFRPETIREINERSLAEDGYKLFEDDPVKIAARYMSAMDSLISARRFTNRLRRDGLVIDAGETAVRSVSPQAVSEQVVQARQAANSLDEAQQYLDDLFTDNVDLATVTKVRSARDTLDKVVGTGGVSGWLKNLPDDPSERMAAVETLMDAVRGVYRMRVERLTAKRATAVGDEAAKLDRQIEAAEKAVADSTISAVMNASVRRSSLGEYLARDGWDAIGATAGRDAVPTMRLPQDLGDDAYVNRFARAVVESHYAVRDPNTLSAKALEVMAPLLGFWKTSATVFRGTGYLSRNVVGGVWNNLLMGVQKGDYDDTIRILAARRDAAGRLGDVTDPLQEAKVLDDGVKEILNDDRLYAYYKSAEQQGLFLDTSRVEYMMRAGLGDQNGTQYILDAEGKKPRVFKNARYRKSAPSDLFYRTAGERNKWQRAANKTVNNAWVNSMSDASTISEEYLRLSAFVRGAKRMQSEANPYGLADGGLAAAGLVKAAHFEYSDLSRLEQDGLKFLVPFYVWTRNNVPLQFRALMTQPKYMLALERAQEGLSGVFADDTEYGQMLQNYLPSFSNERLGFVTPWNPTGGGQLVLGVESPAVDINRLFAWGDNPIDAAQNTLGRFSQEGVSGMNPFIKGAVEAATGRDSFTGASLGGTVDAPNWARVLGLGSTEIGEEQPQVNAALANFVKDLIPQAGMVENLVPLGQPDRNADRFVSSWLSTGLGLPVSTMSPDQLAGQVSRRNDENREFLMGVISDRWPNITKEQYDEYRKLASSGKYSPEQLSAWLDAANAS